jgi:AcrR family transcriptional regulator
VTSRAEIMEAARRIVDRDGWDRLTIRGLAAELGVGATTLYHHVRDKQDLLVQLLGHYADRIPAPLLPAEPRDRIVVAAEAMHAALTGWPEVVEILTADDLIGLAALDWVDAMVGGAIGCGCTPEQAVELYRNIWYFTVGEVLVRVRARRREESGRPRYRDAVYATLDGERFPHLAPIGERWAELAARDTYAAGLRALVDGRLAALAR